MADKKRKVSEASTGATRSIKKSKKTAVIMNDQTEPKETSESTVLANTESSKPVRKPRKRAADFLDEEPTVSASVKGEKDFKSKTKSRSSNSLTADGANGVIEHSEDEDITITTAARSPEKSMMAEAERTVDHEMEDEFGGLDKEEDIDLAPALLSGFDSDNDDPAEDKNFDASRTAPIPQFKKTSKKLRQAASKTEEPGVVYVGRIPHGFYEKEMREYFSQFGTITRLRLSRNKITGASKHFAFIEFESDEVAKIVAETMDNYLMFGHILKCKYAEVESLHPDLWKGANKKYRKIPHYKLIKQREDRDRQALTPEKIEKKMVKERKKREKKQQQMKKLGYEYELPELKLPDMNGALKNEDEVKAILPAAETPDVEGALLPPPTVPKDEIAAKVEKKLKKAKKEKQAKTTTPVEEVPEKKGKKSTSVSEIQPAAESAPKEIPQVKSKKVKTTSDVGTTIKSTQTVSDKKSLVKAAAKDKAEPARKEKQLKSILKKPKKA